ncbi:hypothetical protein ACWDQL_01145 [Streptomyces olivaceus]
MRWSTARPRGARPGTARRGASGRGSSGGGHAPVAAASAVLQLRLPDLDALNATFTMPGAVDLIRRWQGRHPYKAIWVNHEPLPLA